jgi:hypothetical protein
MPSTAIADFSVAYANQNERDCAAFAEAVNSGRLTARTGLWPRAGGMPALRPAALARPRHPGLRPWPGRGLPA